MCFSATASFTAGVILTGIGVATIRKTHHRSQFLFASIPLIFGIQQLSEGILWLTLPNPEYANIQKIVTYIYVLFAQTVWPIWVPIAILLLEKEATRKNIQRFFVLSGLISGLYLAYCLFTFNVEAKIIGKHIDYIQDYPENTQIFSIVLYGLATIVPSFFSHIKRMWMLGVTILISYIITYIFFNQYVLSVWCFFSSIISLSIYAIMIEISNAEKNTRVLNKK
jgi:hypothetical protein